MPHPPPALLVVHLISRSVIRRARLYLAQSEAGDSGNYTCVCDQKLRHTVRLVVTLGTPVVLMMATDERKYVDDNIYLASPLGIFQKTVQQSPETYI